MMKFSKKEKFWKMKDEFIRGLQKKEGKDSLNIGQGLNKLQSKVSSILPNPFSLVSTNDRREKIKKDIHMTGYSDPSQFDYNDTKNIEEFKETPQTLNIFKENKQETMERTKQLFYELSDLMSNFVQKIDEQLHTTKISK
jgi:hypothetical protein